MPFEMSCANCDGRMMVDALGIVVACPHCGTHLAIPAEVPGITESPAEEIPPPVAEQSLSSYSYFAENKIADPELEASESNVLVSEPDLHTESEVPSALRVANPDPSSVIPAIVTDMKPAEPASGFPVLSDPSGSASASGNSDISDSKIASLGNFGMPNADPDSAPRILTGAADEEADFPQLEGATSADDPPSGAPSPGFFAPDSAAMESQEFPSEEANAPTTVQTSQGYDSVYSSRRGKQIPNPIFQAWLSYTILVTAGLIMAIYYIFRAPTSNLESLPDVKPVEKSGKVVRQLVPEKANMPRGHTLALNETQRFGNIEVTPLKVTQGPLVLVGRDYVEESRKIQEEGTVLKLWVRFKNVSEDQTIAPLDDDLLFFRDYRDDRKAGALANNFVCPAEEKSEQGNLVLVYDHNVDDDYDLKDEKIGMELKPGEEVEMYIPTEPDGWDELQGPLIWRVHIRKGYSPSNYGVTTIFEVAFPSDAIESEASNA